MGAPVFPWFGGEFMGVKPPKPINKLISNKGLLSGTQNIIKYPAPDTAFDGSYLLQSYTSNAYNLYRYNASNTLVWTLSASAIASGALGGTSAASTSAFGPCYASDGSYYLLAYSSTAPTARLIKLSSPATTANVTTVGSIFSYPLGYVASDPAPENHAFFEQADGNLQLRASSMRWLVINKSTGAVVSSDASGVIYQSGVALSGNQTVGLYYESLDQTIQVTGTGYGYIPSGYIAIFRGGKLATIKFPYSLPSSGSLLTIRLWGGYVLVSSNNDYQVAGCTGFLRTDFDRWLHDVCDAMDM